MAESICYTSALFGMWLALYSITKVIALNLYLSSLVAPSTPVCKQQGTAQYSQDITLTCASAEGSPTPTYSWKRFNVQNQSVPQDSRTTDSK